MAFDVSMWNYSVGNHLVIVKSLNGNDQTRKRGGGRDFVFNDDGTISVKPARHLVLGTMEPPETGKEGEDGSDTVDLSRVRDSRNEYVKHNEGRKSQCKSNRLEAA